MKKNYILIMMSIFLLAGCAKEKLQGSRPQSGKSNVTNSAGDGQNDLLGYGYDATGEYANSSAAKFSVVDIPRLKADQPLRVEWDLSSEQRGDLTAGENAYTYVQGLTAKVSSEVNVLLFKGSITGSFKDTSSFSSKYVYSTYNLIIKQKRVKVNADMDMLRSYLTPTFLADIQNNSAEYIIRQYGTHVLTDIVLGAKLEVDYRSETSNSDRRTAAAAGVDVSVKTIFKLTTNYNYNTGQTSQNKSQSLHYRTIGGEPSKGLVGDLVIGGDQTVNISNWQNSSSIENSEMIDISPNGMVPVYEFISDPVKKAAVKSYYDQYLLDHRVVLTPDPVYVFYSNSQSAHLFTIAPNDYPYASNGWQQLGIAFYAFTSQAPGTDPVYQFYRSTGSDRVYTINRNDFPYAQNGYADYGPAFYAYRSASSGALPVSVFYSSSLADHTYTINRNDYPYAQNGYADLGVNFYAIKK